MSKTNPPYSQDKIAELRALVADCPTWLEAREKIAKQISVDPDNVTRMNRKYGFWKSQRGGQNLDAFDASVETSKAQTIEEVISLCKVDTDQWESKGFSVSRRQNGFGWTARFQRKKTPLNADTLLAEFVARAAKHAPKFSVKPVKAKPGGRLLELAIPDLHLAKLCWAQETGHKDYDIKIAADLFRKAVDGLVESARGMNISRVLFPVGNDLMNSDNAAGTTTAGTPQAQSEDSRWKKTFMTACDLIVEAVEKLAKEFPVDVVIVPGNHDQERCFYMGQYLKSWFRLHVNVTVDNSATPRKYYRFGKTLLGYTHGSDERPARLPGIMANERRDLWAQTDHHEWHLGHLHREITTEEIGVKVRWLASLCPPDEWHSNNGFIGNDQAAEAFVYDEQSGMIATLYFRP